MKKTLDISFIFGLLAAGTVGAASIVEVDVDSGAEVKSFDQSKLKHVETEGKNPLPTADILKAESADNRAEVKSFDQNKLNHVETREKTLLPTVDTLSTENVDSRAEVKSFDQSKLKHVETEEKNPLPTANIEIK